MNPYGKLIPALLLAAGLGTLAVPVFAESGCGAMSDRDYRHERYSKNMEQHQKKLHDTLKLSVEQEPAWKKLVESEQVMHSAKPIKREDWSKLSVTERADKMLEMSKARQERMGEHVVALKAFYATLTPAQQKSFEDFHAGARSSMGNKHRSGMNKADMMQAPNKP